MDQEQILSQDSETAGSQQDETQKEKTYFADYTLKAPNDFIDFDCGFICLFWRLSIHCRSRATPPCRDYYGGSGLLCLFFSLVSTSK